MKRFDSDPSDPFNSTRLRRLKMISFGSVLYAAAMLVFAVGVGLGNVAAIVAGLFLLFSSLATWRKAWGLM